MRLILFWVAVITLCIIGWVFLFNGNVVGVFTAWGALVTMLLCGIINIKIKE